MIYDIKDDLTLQVPSQEPSMSSNYPMEARDSWQSYSCAGNVKLSIQADNHNMKMILDIEDDPILQVPSQEPSTSPMEVRDSCRSNNHFRNVTLMLRLYIYSAELSLLIVLMKYNMESQQIASSHSGLN